MRRTIQRSGRSISFSGAGFLGSYHAGVIAALQKAGALPDYRKAPVARGREDRHGDITFLGSSAGSLVSAGILTGQSTDELMDVCHLLCAEARMQPVDIATPGFDLLDHLEPHLRKHIDGAGDDDRDRALASGRLRVFLTDVLPTDLWRVVAKRGLLERVRVLDSFASPDHLVGALLLSSYIPGATGRLRAPDDSAVGRARCAVAAHWGLKVVPEHAPAAAAAAKTTYAAAAAAAAAAGRRRRGDAAAMDDFHDGGALAPYPAPAGGAARGKAAQSLYDGGLGFMWPTLDARTVIVSPLAVHPIGRRNAGRPVICPKSSASVAVPMASSPSFSSSSSPASSSSLSSSSSSSSSKAPFRLAVPLGAHGVAVDGSLETVRLGSKMLLSSEPQELDKSFARGFDDANRFLREGGTV